MKKIVDFCKNHKRELAFGFAALFFVGLYASKQLKNQGGAFYAAIGFGTLAVAAAFSLALCRYSRCKSFSLPAAWLLMALGFGVLRIFTITPIAGWDEYGHYEISYRYSDFLLFKFKSPHLMDKNHADYSNLEIQNNVKTAYLRYKDPFFLKEREQVNQERIPSTPNPFQYLPQALGLVLGRILRFNFMPLFFIGRLFNLLFYVFCIWLAIKAVPFGKLTIFACGLLPLTLHQAASFSMDSYVLAVGFLFFALLVKAMASRERISKNEIAALCVCSFLLSPSKLVYWPVAWLAFFIPPKRFSSKKNWFLAAALVALSGLFAILLCSLPSMLRQAGGSGGVKTLYNGERGWTLSDVLHNPLRVANMFLWTLRYTWDSWFPEAMGIVISGLPAAVPLWCRQAHVFILLATAFVCRAPSELSLNEHSEQVLGAAQKAGLALAVAGVVALTIFGELMIWTPLNATGIEGVQGRYFLPVFPLILFLFRNKIFVVTQNIDRAVFVAEIFLQFYLVFMSVNLTL